jgi:hypothetical protein
MDNITLKEQLVIFVRDFNPGIPMPRNVGPDDKRGRGLLLVKSLSDRSGWYQPEDGTPGKVAWAVVSLSAGHSGRGW